MTQYDNTNGFVLFQNDKTSDNQPDYTGKITLADGKEMRLAGWKKVGQNAKTFVSGKASEFQEQGSQNGNRQQAPVADLDDEIPF